MYIYLVEKETHKLIRQYENVIDWSIDYIEYQIGQGICKEYCNKETEYFTDMMPEEN